MSLKRKAPSSDGNLNSDFCQILIELAEWEKNVNRNQFKSGAYRKAAAAIAKLDFRLTSGDEAKKIPGIGEKIAKKIDEIISTGKLAKLENIRTDDASIAINLLTRVSGIGPSKAKDLFDEGIENIDDLKKQEQKLTHAQKVGLKHFEDFEKRIPRKEIDEIFEKLEKSVLNFDPQYEMVVCGSYRRGLEASGDIDILLTHSDFKQSDKTHGDLLHRVVKHLEKEHLITDKISEGDTKFMGVCQLHKDASFRRLDIRLLPKENYYCGILYFTGSDSFNKEMRAAAIQKGFTLNEYSLRPLVDGKAQEPLPVSSEEDIFDYIDFPFREPKNRK